MTEFDIWEKLIQTGPEDLDHVQLAKIVAGHVSGQSFYAGATFLPGEISMIQNINFVVFFTKPTEELRRLAQEIKDNWKRENPAP
jgi:hypothetical protein